MFCIVYLILIFRQLIFSCVQYFDKVYTKKDSFTEYGTDISFLNRRLQLFSQFFKLSNPFTKIFMNLIHKPF